MAEAASAVAASASFTPPKGVEKVNDKSILYIQKKALRAYNKLKKRPQKYKYVIYSIDKLGDTEEYVYHDCVRVIHASSLSP